LDLVPASRPAVLVRRAGLAGVEVPQSHRRKAVDSRHRRIHGRRAVARRVFAGGMSWPRRLVGADPVTRVRFHAGMAAQFGTMGLDDDGYIVVGEPIEMSQVSASASASD